MIHNTASIPLLHIPDPSNDWIDAVPKLPKPRQRWTARRKASVIEAVRGGWVPIEEICDLYKISVDEFLAWERNVDRYGVAGLRSTRYQIYRDTEKTSGTREVRLVGGRDGLGCRPYHGTAGWRWR